MVKVILIEVMLCVKWYRADLLKTWMSAPISFQSTLHWSSFFCWFFLWNRIHKNMSCKASPPKFSYITSQHIHWPSASHFQRSLQNSQVLSPALVINSYLFAKTSSERCLVQISGFSVHCSIVTASPSRERETVHRIKDVRDIKFTWLTEIRSLYLNCFFNAVVCVYNPSLQGTQRSITQVGYHWKSDLINTHSILSFALTLLENIVPATPTLLHFRSVFEK